MASLLEAMKKANLVNDFDAQMEEDKKRSKMKLQEKLSDRLVRARATIDSEEQEKQERFLKRASKETTKAGSRVGTKQYYDRFKK